MKKLVEKMYIEIEEARKNTKRHLGSVDVEFVANARIAMQNGNCKISFKKGNGEIVETIATTRGNVVKYSVKDINNRSTAITPFFDLTQMRWRSFRWDRLISCELVK